MERASQRATISTCSQHVSDRSLRAVSFPPGWLFFVNLMLGPACRISAVHCQRVSSSTHVANDEGATHLRRVGLLLIVPHRSSPAE